MFDKLRWPLFLIAVILFVVALGLEMGGSLLPDSFSPREMRRQTITQLAGTDMDDDERDELIDRMVAEAGNKDRPPGMAIPYMGLLDGLLLYTLGLLALALVVPDRVHGRIQGVVTLIVSFLVLLAAIGYAIQAFVTLLIMVALFLAPPFGTIAYLAKWGFFNRGGAAAILAGAELFKLAGAGFLVFAHQRFLQLKSLMFLVLFSLLANLLTGWLHALVPSVLVSIADAVAALIIAIVAAIFAIVFLVSAILSIIRVIV